MSLGNMEQRTEGMKKQAQFLIEQAYQRGYKAGQVDNQEFHESICDGCKKGFEDREMELIEYGRTEAWEVAKKIVSSEPEGGLSFNELLDLFGTRWFGEIFNKFLASEVIEKLRTYKEQKKQDEEIKVGDEVEVNEVKVIVTKIDGKYFNGVGYDGGTYSESELRLWKKTGRHFPEIVEVLKKMQEADKE